MVLRAIDKKTFETDEQGGYASLIARWEPQSDTQYHNKLSNTTKVQIVHVVITRHPM